MFYGYILGLYLSVYYKIIVDKKVISCLENECTQQKYAELTWTRGLQ